MTDKLTAVVRDLLGNYWESSPIRAYMNSLRRHVRGEEFNQDWNNGVLSSLASVILKGDDWEVLLDFMKRKGMTDYRLAFAFYGVFNGFANLTRDFTDLLLNNDSSYVASVYKEFYRSIHGRKIDVSSNILECHSTIESRPLQTYRKTFKEKIWDFYYSNVRKRKKNQNKLDEELKSALDKIEDSEDGYVFVCVLNDYSMWRTKTKAWQEMQQKFCPEYEAIRSTKVTWGGIFAGFEDNQNAPSYSAIKPLSQGKTCFFDENLHTESAINPNGNNQKVNSTAKSIINDDYAIEFIKTFIGKKSGQILDLFIEFQKSYRTGYYSKNPSQYRRNNSDVIDHFCKWCLSTKNSNALEKNPENSRMLDKLKLNLLKYYRD